jgi:hypothetical protein
MNMCAKQFELLLIYCSKVAHFLRKVNLLYLRIAELRENKVMFRLLLIINVLYLRELRDCCGILLVFAGNSSENCGLARP